MANKVAPYDHTLPRGGQALRDALQERLDFVSPFHPERHGWRRIMRRLTALTPTPTTADVIPLPARTDTRTFALEPAV